MVPRSVLLLLCCLGAQTAAYKAVCADRSNCTAALQRALDTGSAGAGIVTVPFTPDNTDPWQVSPLFLRRSNFKLVIEPGVVIEAMEGSFKGTNDCLLTAEMVSNVSVVSTGATLKMRRPYLPPGKNVGRGGGKAPASAGAFLCGVPPLQQQLPMRVHVCAGGWAGACGVLTFKYTRYCVA